MTDVDPRADGERDSPRAVEIFQFIDSLRIAKGGPVQTAFLLRRTLARHRIRSTLVTLDCDADLPTSARGAPIMRIDGAIPFFSAIVELDRLVARQNDSLPLFVLHGLWSPYTIALGVLLRRRRIPYVVFPHGMLDPVFRRLYPFRHAKKLAWWLVFERRLLNRAAAVLFTCQEERRLAARTFPGYCARGEVVPYGIENVPADREACLRAFRDAAPAVGTGPYLVFLSRVHHKKGLHLLIDAFRRVSDRYPEMRLVVAGDASNAYGDRLVARCRDDPVLSVRVVWTGMLTGAAKYGALYGARCFVLPSFQENFGIAVVEAMACGVPVIVGRGVNIHEDIVTAGAGLCCEPMLPSVEDALLRFLALSTAEQEAMRGRARALARERFSEDSFALGFSTLVRRVLGEVGNR